MRSIEPILATVALAVGVAAVFFSGIGFPSSPVAQELPRHAILNPNPFALRGSAFGSLLSRLAEDDIDKIWHLGLEGGIHSGGDGWLAWAREEKSRRTNPSPPGGTHAAAIRRDLRQMLVNAFLLDPGSFTIYEALYLFLTSMDAIDQAEGARFADELSEFTLHWISGETEDPEPWLTAAAASINLHLSAGHSAGEPDPVRSLPAKDESGISNAAACLNRFDVLWAESRAAGRCDLLSAERRNEINERRAFLGRLVAAWQKREKEQEQGTETPPSL